MRIIKLLETKSGRWLPLVLTVTFLALNYYTSVFGNQMHDQEIVWLAAIVNTVKPYVFTGVASVVLFSIIYLIYVPLKMTLKNVLDREHIKPKPHIIIMRTFTLIYWGFVAFIAVSFIFSAFVSKVFVGAGVFGAAIALILQGLATDFVYGIMLQFGAKFNIGDSITLSEIGYTPISGTVVNILLLSTILETPNGQVMLPNSQLWKQPITINKPAVKS